jgi:hypothetical protein
LALDKTKGSLHILVVDEFGRPIQESEVFVFDIDGDLIYEGRTGRTAASFYPTEPGYYVAYALTENRTAGSAHDNVSGHSILRIETKPIPESSIVVSDLDSNIYGSGTSLIAGKPITLLISLYGNYSNVTLPLNTSVNVTITEKVSVNLFSTSGDVHNVIYARTNEMGQLLIPIMATSSLLSNNLNISVSVPATAGFTMNETSITIPVTTERDPVSGERIDPYSHQVMEDTLGTALDALIHAAGWMSNCAVC